MATIPAPRYDVKDLKLARDARASTSAAHAEQAATRTGAGAAERRVARQKAGKAVRAEGAGGTKRPRAGFSGAGSRDGKRAGRSRSGATRRAPSPAPMTG